MIALADFSRLNPTPMMQGIVQVITNTSLFLRRLKFIPVDGFAYKFNREIALGTVGFRNIGAYYTDAGKTDSSLTPLLIPLSVFGGTVRTDRQLVNHGGDRVRASKIAAKVHKSSLFFDANVINGQPATTPGGFLGIKAWATGKQLLNFGANGAALATDQVAALQDAVVGSNEQKILVMSKFGRRLLSAACRADAKGMSFTEATSSSIGQQGQVIPGQPAKFNGSDIEVLDEDGDEQPIMPATETMGSSGAVCTSMYCANMGQDMEEQNLQGLVGSKMIEHVAYGERSGVYEDLIESLMGLATFHPRCAARLQGITGTAPTYGP